MTFSAPEWLAHSTFYQIFPDRFANGDPSNDPPGASPWGAAPELFNHFGGDLQGIYDRLPYLEGLGIDAIYLTPIFEAQSNHKYDTWDYRKIDPAFGTLELFKKLVSAAHTRGIRIVLDAVFNHCGDGFWAFRDLMAHGPQSRYRDWFFPTDFPIRQQPPNYQTCGGADFLPKLNLANPEVREHLLDVARYWIDACGIDGWRLDVPWKAPMDFWRELRDVVKRANPEAAIVGEVWRDPAPWLEGDTCDGIMNYPLRDYILDFCVNDHMDAEDFDHFAGRLREVYGAAAPYQLNLLGSHDTPRILTLCRGDVQRLALAVTAQFTLPGAPMVYYGDEIGMPGENDPDCRRTMRWDESTWDPAIGELYRRLIRLRREQPALRRGGLEPLLVFNGVYAYRRASGDGQVIVILNPRHARQGLRIPLPEGSAGARAWVDAFTGRALAAAGGEISLPDLPAKSALVLVAQDRPQPTE